MSRKNSTNGIIYERLSHLLGHLIFCLHRELLSGEPVDVLRKLSKKVRIERVCFDQVVKFLN